LAGTTYVDEEGVAALAAELRGPSESGYSAESVLRGLEAVPSSRLVADALADFTQRFRRQSHAVADYVENLGAAVGRACTTLVDTDRHIGAAWQAMAL